MICGEPLKDSTKRIYNTTNVPFQKTFGVSYAEALTKVPELRLQKRPTKTEKKKERRDHNRKVKENIEKQWQQNDVKRYVYMYMS